MAGIDKHVKRIGELLESREDVAQQECEQGRQQGPGQARTPHIEPTRRPKRCSSVRADPVRAKAGASRRCASGSMRRVRYPSWTRSTATATVHMQDERHITRCAAERFIYRKSGVHRFLARSSPPCRQFFGRGMTGC
jgi:hypothetical protein